MGLVANNNSIPTPKTSSILSPLVKCATTQRMPAVWCFTSSGAAVAISGSGAGRHPELVEGLKGDLIPVARTKLAGDIHPGPQDSGSGRLSEAKPSKRLHRNSVPEQSGVDIKSPHVGQQPSTPGSTELAHMVVLY